MLIAETGPVTERVRVREIDDDEGQWLVRIIRRGSGSVVTWRRAQMMLLSAQGMLLVHRHGRNRRLCRLRQPELGGQPEPSGVPTAFIQFAHDIGIYPLIEQEHNITRWTDVDHGGHFAATESADELVHDLRAFFHELR